ncbi:MAG: hypothetical protein LBK43_05310 [Treponema sp.]|jgi:hypothetical protein|nr:hypothetical protein [Treponema sp.]
MKLLPKTDVLLILLALSLIGCSAAGSGSLFVIEAVPEEALVSPIVSLIPVPVHREYHEAATFAKTEEHLGVFAVYHNGNTQKFPLDKIAIMLEQTLITSTEPHAFNGTGEKEVTLTYQNLSAQYTIIVRSDTETPGAVSPSTPGGGDTSLVIDIQWK